MFLASIYDFSGRFNEFPHKDKDGKCTCMITITNGMSYDLIIIWCLVLVDWLTEWPNVGMILQ